MARRIVENGRHHGKRQEKQFKRWQADIVRNRCPCGYRARHLVGRKRARPRYLLSAARRRDQNRTQDVCRAVRPLSGDMEWGIALRPEVHNFPQGAVESRFWEISRDQGATWQLWDCEPDELTQWVTASEDTVGCLIRVTEYAVLEDGSGISCTSAPFGPIEEQRGFSLGGTATQGNRGPASSNSSAPVDPVVYVCESAGNAYYHTYDCDELSLLRQRGYSTIEMALSEASKLYQPCPVCQG